jgi:hypothetical protein
MLRLKEAINHAMQGKYANYIDMAARLGLSQKRVQGFMTGEYPSLNLKAVLVILEALELSIQGRAVTEARGGNEIEFAKIAIESLRKEVQRLETLLSLRAQTIDALKRKVKNLRPVAEKIIFDHGSDADLCVNLAQDIEALYVYLEAESAAWGESPSQITQ